MKVLLVALNSKFIHTNLALRSLKSFGELHLSRNSSDYRIFNNANTYGKSVDFADKYNCEIDIAEYTINQPLDKIRADIYRKSPDVIFISCYIWNISQVNFLVSDFAKICPTIDIWLGGPEVSYDANETLLSMPGAKGIIRGEGERSFAKLLDYYISGCEIPLSTIGNLTYRALDGAIANTSNENRMDFDEIPFPYTETATIKNQIIYYESSRGCPFRCSYCLSSVDKMLAFRSVSKVIQELKFFMDRNVPQVKFIDRTFNCKKTHSRDIWNFIKNNDNGVTNFHFEIAADLLDDEDLDILGSMRAGLVQLEIGVQSTNTQTIHEINRPMDFNKVSNIVKRIISANNVHVHLDLIAGLPYENFESFTKSFNDVFALKPHQLQLGFLKVLKGSPMESRKHLYGLEYSDSPPYEVLSTNWISYDEILRLKAAEEMLDIYYNSGQFNKSVEYLCECGSFNSTFDVFDSLASWYKHRHIDMINHSRNSRYENLIKFSSERLDDMELFMKAITYDYYSRDNAKNRPDFLGSETVSKEVLKEFYRRESDEHSILNSSENMHADSRTLRHNTHIELIDESYLIFDYTNRNPITGNANVIIVNKQQIEGE